MNKNKTRLARCWENIINGIFTLSRSVLSKHMSLIYITQARLLRITGYLQQTLFIPSHHHDISGGFRTILSQNGWHRAVNSVWFDLRSQDDAGFAAPLVLSPQPADIPSRQISPTATNSYQTNNWPGWPPSSCVYLCLRPASHASYLGPTIKVPSPHIS